MQLHEFAKSVRAKAVEDLCRLLFHFLAGAFFSVSQNRLTIPAYNARIQPERQRTPQRLRDLLGFGLHPKIEALVLEVAAHKVLLAELVEHSHGALFA